ncbi:MAG: flagellar motor switch protein FliN, partial [Phycisphaerales bacterium]|nr:flagellar motor switch protein FliN [Phycisphaerales bacterium]
MADDPQQSSETTPVQGGADSALSPVAEAQKPPTSSTMDDGDLLKQEDLDALFAAAGGGSAGGESGASTASVEASDARRESPPQVLRSEPPDRDAEAFSGDTTEALAGGGGVSRDAPGIALAGTPSESAADVQRFQYPDFGATALPGVDAKRVTMLSDVKLRVKIELGRTRMLVEEVLKLGEGSVVGLDKLAGDPVDVYANDRLVARGEVLVLDDSFCVRINEVIT